ncbi:hypothetical protein Q8F55_003020 [Vanrija albida]|uniref:Uncharacterized protein n=1 Tax=Vanrija albida TaxID=181172 RepID=A0ABR3QCC7_9TREE
MLDALAYPHIFDAVVAHAEWDALLALRPTCSAVCAQVDRALAAHLAYTAQGCFAVLGSEPARASPRQLTHPRPRPEAEYELELLAAPGRPAKRVKVSAEAARSLLNILAAGTGGHWDVVVHPLAPEPLAPEDEGAGPAGGLRRLPVSRPPLRGEAPALDAGRRARYAAAIAHAAALDTHMTGLGIFPSGRMPARAECPRVHTVRCHGAARYNVVPRTLVVFAQLEAGFQKPPRVRAGVPPIQAGTERVVLNVAVPPGCGAGRVDTLVLPPSVGEVVVLLSGAGEAVEEVAPPTPQRVLDYLVSALVPKLRTVRYTLVGAEGWDSAWVHGADEGKNSAQRRVAAGIKAQVASYGGSRGWTAEQMELARGNVEFVPLGAWRERVGEDAFRLETVA